GECFIVVRRGRGCSFAMSAFRRCLLSEWVRVFGQSIRSRLLATLNRETKLQAGDQAFELIRVSPLAGAYEALYRYASGVGQRNQDAAVGFLDAEVDVVVWLKYVADLLEWTVHAGYLNEMTAPNGPRTD